MEIDKLIEAYLASRQKQFARLSKNGVARIAYLAGYLAAQPTLAPDACPVCRGKKGYRDAFDEWYPCRACNGTGSAGKA